MTSMTLPPKRRLPAAHLRRAHLLGELTRHDRRLPSVRLAVAIATAAALVGALAATPPGLALVSDIHDWFSSWRDGRPGEAATPQQEAEFGAENVASYSRFREGTQLGVLGTTVRDGVRVDLFGLRDGGALCLRIARHDAKHPPMPQCAAISELERKQWPAALVVSDQGLWLDEAAGKRVSASYGVAADDVTAIELASAAGERFRVTPEHNGFFVLRDLPHGAWITDDPIVSLTAVDRDGHRASVPVFQWLIRGTSGNSLPPAKVEMPGPAVPDYLPGPSGVGWLARGEARGEPFDNRDRLIHAMGEIKFSRAIQPDPKLAFRVGLTVVEIIDEQYARPGSRGETWLCTSALSPLAAGDLSGSCGPLATWFADRPLLTALPTMGQQFTTVTGVASDDVARLSLILHDGTRLEVALADNVFAEQVASVDFPAKLVGYDAFGRVIAVHPFLTAPVAMVLRPPLGDRVPRTKGAG